MSIQIRPVDSEEEGENVLVPFLLAFACTTFFLPFAFAFTIFFLPLLLLSQLSSFLCFYFHALNFLI